MLRKAQQKTKEGFANATSDKRKFQRKLNVRVPSKSVLYRCEDETGKSVALIRYCILNVQGSNI